MECLSDPLEDFFTVASGALRHPADRERLKSILIHWGASWKGRHRSLLATRSHHGTHLHFNQLIQGHWCQAFTFVASTRHGVSLRGPDPNRARKAHKLRRHRLDPSSLDNLFQAWSAHAEAKAAGSHSVEFLLKETPDEVWQACLQEALDCLGP